ncbi:MAG: ATP-binding protein [Pirellulaceae bacterium]|nr:ATP-binding protein [Pirellulaceae bacterium]
MAAAGVKDGQQILDLIDAGTGALGRNDRGSAAQKYAQASEILFHRAKKCQDTKEKVTLARRAQQLLHTVRSIRNLADGEVDQAGTGNESTGTLAVGAGPRLKSGLTFDDVAGLDDVKEALRLRLIYPLRHPDKMAQYGLRAGGGLLLYGPPGTGKTMIAKALAGELDLPFMAIKPSEVLSKWFGESAQKLAALFEEARQYPSGAIIFIDEIDSIGSSRNQSNASEGSRRLLTQLLQELDGVQGRDQGLLFLAATNEPWLLDSALLRPGRFDERCLVPLPDLAARQVLLQLQLKDCWLADDVDLGYLARQAERYSGADLMCLCERAKQVPFREAVLQGTDRPINQDDFRLALDSVRPSISTDVVRKFENYASSD